MKKVTFYKAMIPAGTFEKCTGYQFCIGIHEYIVHKTPSDGWTVSHKSTGMRVLTPFQEQTTRRAAVELITRDPALIAKIENSLKQPHIKAAENRLFDFLEGITR